MTLETQDDSGSSLGLEEIEAFYRSLTKCPRCNSTEGFWLAANRERSYVQCKHCGTILEIYEVFPESEKIKGTKGVFKRLKP
jgi:translation initiation factor 2 beta subunit (eIF-2beta)/eIF-5